jgi:hypothetical protein
VVVPETPDDLAPGAAEDACGVGVDGASGVGAVVDVTRPGVVAAACVRELVERVAKAVVAGPPEGGVFGFAGCDGERALAGVSGERGVGGERSRQSPISASKVAAHSHESGAMNSDRKVGPSGCSSSACRISMVSSLIRATIGPRADTSASTMWRRACISELAGASLRPAVQPLELAGGLALSAW